MKAQHAPGPWTMDEVRTDSGRAFRIGTGEMLKAGKGCCIIYDDHGVGDNERKANAVLIVAAPDMLAELRQCQTELEEAANLLRPSLSGMARIYLAASERVAAAIAKATGAA